MVQGWNNSDVAGSSAGPTGDVILLAGTSGIPHCSNLAQLDGLGGFTQSITVACGALGGGWEVVGGSVDRKDDVLFWNAFLEGNLTESWAFGREGPGPFGASGVSSSTTPSIGVSFMGTDAAGTTLLGCSVNGTWNFGGGPQSGNLLVSYDQFGQYKGSIPDPGVQHIDDAGNLYLSKTFTGTSDVGCGPVTGGAGTSTLFAKLDPAGACLWSKAFGVTGTSFTVDAVGEVLIMARFSGTVALGGPSLTSAGTTDLAVAKLDTAGNHLWSRSFGGVGAALSAPILVQDEIATDLSGSLVTHGVFTGTVDFGNGPVTAGAAGETFVFKLAPSGALSWARTFANGGPLSVTAAGDGSVILTASNWYPGLDLGCGPLASRLAVVKLAP